MATLPAVKLLGQTDYRACQTQMQEFTQQRDHKTQDQIWLTYHPPTFTLGVAGKKQHLLDPGDIPVIRSTRGGQVTYHCPGQVVAYVLVDLHRAGYGIRSLVNKVEQAMLDLLEHYAITATRIPKRPGVYVSTAKIGAVGMRISRGCSYHGCSLNVNCDLADFARMHTCGYTDITDTSMQDQGVTVAPSQIAKELGKALQQTL